MKVRIDPNVRVGHATIVGFEDFVDCEPGLGDCEVFEEESELHGKGMVTSLDYTAQLAHVTIIWQNLVLPVKKPKIE